jgi:hypothetical protein
VAKGVLCSGHLVDHVVVPVFAAMTVRCDQQTRGIFLRLQAQVITVIKTGSLWKLFEIPETWLIGASRKSKAHVPIKVLPFRNKEQFHGDESGEFNPHVDRNSPCVLDRNLFT